jgi:hypothetical protein
MKDAEKTPNALRFSNSVSMPEVKTGPKLNSENANFLPSKQRV